MFCRSRYRRLCCAAVALIVILLEFLPRPAAAQWVILHGKNGHVEQGVPAETVKTLKDLAKKGAQLSSIAFSPNGGWIILHDKYAMFARNAPTEAVRRLAEQQDKKVDLKTINFTFAGGWTAFSADGPLSWDIGPEPFDKLGELGKAGHKTKSIGFSPEGGWVIFYDKNSYFAKGIPEHAYDKIIELAKKNADLKSIFFARNGGWVILYNKNGVAYENIPKAAEKALTDLTKRGAPIKSVAFMTGPFLPLSEDDEETRQEVLFRMNRSDVPGLGIALINNGQLEWARGYGVLRAKQETAVTEHTRFQAGAVSQSLAALAALRLVDEKKLGLDQGLNEKLKSWKVPDNEFTRQKAPTLRHVLSHSAGFNVPAFRFKAEPTPTLQDVLQGKAETPAVDVTTTPGTKLVDSAGGYLVVQQLLTDVTGTPFPELMQELVLDPVGMKESTFQQPLPKEWEAKAAIGHFVDQEPLPGRWSNCTPALAVAGLWSTPTDLARFVIAVCDAYQGKAKPILGAKQIQALLTRQIDDMGLGVNLIGKDRTLAFIQKAGNPGYTCYLIAYPATGQGAVIMTNSDSGERVINELVENLRMEYGWPE